MTQEEKFAYWIQLAQYDIDTADTMFNGGRWFYVVFMCQQAIEKLCKGLYNFYIDDNVPKVHNIRFVLSKLENALSVPVSAEVYDFIDSLSAYYLTNRYPDFAAKPDVQINKTTAEQIAGKSREVYAWLLTLKR